MFPCVLDPTMEIRAPLRALPLSLRRSKYRYLYSKPTLKELGRARPSTHVEWIFDISVAVFSYFYSCSLLSLLWNCEGASPPPEDMACGVECPTLSLFTRSPRIPKLESPILDLLASPAELRCEECKLLLLLPALNGLPVPLPSLTITSSNCFGRVLPPRGTRICVRFYFRVNSDRGPVPGQGSPCTRIRESDESDLRLIRDGKSPYRGAHSTDGWSKRTLDPALPLPPQNSQLY
jgi:hypothetical protein